jgi:flagellar biosynthesis protein FliQ
MDILMEHVGQGLWLILLLSLPIILLAAGVGLVVGILQAVTQVQEQTISAAPKIFFVFLLLIFGGPFMVQVLKDFMTESVHLGMEVVPRSEAMILPPKPRLAYGEKNSKMDFFKEPHRSPTDSKIKAMMSTPSNVQGSNSPVGSVHTHTHQAKPTAGVGEQIYMNRRATGQLPKPPNGKE